MSPDPRTASRLLAAFAASILGAGAAHAATYLPLSDEDLAQRSPVIVRARVIEAGTRLATLDGADAVVTVTHFQPLEVFKGRIASETFKIELPGGASTETTSWMPGTPSFDSRNEVILFLRPSQSGDDAFDLTEFGLSKFDVLEDRASRRFAVRSVFRPEEDDYLALRESAPVASGAALRPLRDAESFESSLRSAGSGEGFPGVVYAPPDGEVRVRDAATPAWVNVGGSEGTGSLYRWCWDSGRSGSAIVSAVSTQSGLSDGSDGLSAIANAVTQWSGISEARVLYSQSSGSALVVVNLDVDSKSSYWSGPLPCKSGGIIGLGGPATVSPAGSFKGDGGYSAITSGTVWMRRVTGGCYSIQTFRTAVLHELGHTLGLGHSDQATSFHSTTSLADWATAVMVSSVPPSHPSTPQPDDIEAILWLYGPGSGGAVPSARFDLAANPVDVGQPVQFTDTSTGSPTSWSWSFGDGASSTQRNPSHTYASGGTFTVVLTASNGFGSSVHSQTVTILPDRLHPLPVSRSSPRLLAPRPPG